MSALLQALLSPSGFIPHGHCYLWQRDLVSLHLVSDGLIAIAYYSIPITLLYFVHKRQDVPFNRLFLLFSAFIVTCGTTHLMEVWTLWHSTYWLSGVIKAITAAISVYTAFVLVSILPQALALPTPTQLEAVNRELQREITQHQQTEATLQQMHGELELRVAERTAQLVVANQDLNAEMIERQKAETALRESEERLRLALAAANQGIYDVNFQTGEVIVNSSYATMLGYDPAKFQDSVAHWVERLHPEDRDRAVKLYQDYIAGEISEYQSEFRLKTGNGDWIWILSVGKILAWDEDGQPLRMLGTYTDINDRKQAEVERLRAKKLRLELNLLENILEVTLAGYWDWDIPGNQEYLSPTFKRMFGYEDDELPNTPKIWQRLIFAEDLPGMLARFEQHINSRGQIPYYNEVRYRHKDGSTVWVICSGRVIEWDREGNPLRMIGCHIDITQRKLAETRLEASEAELRALFAAMTDTVIVRDRAGRCLKIAPNRFGLDRDVPEMLGRTLHEVLPPPEADLLLAKIHECLAHQTTTSAEYCLTIQGRTVYFLASISPLSEDAVIVVARDISDRKQIEENLRILSERLTLALESGAIGIWEWDFDNQAYWDNRMYELYGIPPSQPVPDFQAWLNFVHPDDRAMVEAAHYTALQNSKNLDLEFRIICLDGSMRFLKVYALIQRNPQGEPSRIVGISYDITDRKQTEQELIHSRDLREAIFNELADALFLVDPQTLLIQDCNRRAVELFGAADSAQLIGRQGHTLQRGAFSEQELADSVLEMQAKGFWSRELEYVTLQGEFFWGNIAAKPIVVAGQAMNLVRVTDISDRKRAENALRESERRFATLAAAAPVAIYRFNAIGECIYVNARWSEITGRPPEAGLGMGWLETVYPEDRERIYNTALEWSQTCKAGDLYRNEARILRPDGSLIWYFCQMLPETDSEGNPIGSVGILVDITDRKQAEEALANYAREVEDLYNNAPCGYHSLDSEGRYVNINETELRWLGYTREEIIGKPFTNFITEASRSVFEQNYPRFKQQGWVNDLEFDLICKDGTLFQVVLNATAVKSADQHYLYSRSTLFDIRDRKQAEAQLRLSSERLSLANAELARAARLKDEFLAGMSHELRTPLNAILGLSEALLEEVYGDLTSEQKDSIQMIEKSGHHLLLLINDILDLSKIESGKMEMELSTIRVQHLCESSLAFVKQQATHKQIQFSCQIDEGLADLKGDERRLRQVLVNLLSNAVKFTPEQGSVQLQVTANPLQETIEFSIIDTGIGIAPEQMDRLFQPFVQLDSSLSRRYEGTGLGLALVRRIMDLHGGSVSLESEAGRGSRFTIALPWVPPTDSVELGSPDALPELPQAEIGRALIVEDSEAAASQLVRYLASLGAQAVVHTQGEGALAMAIELQPDVIILDILLPDQSGWEVLVALKANPSTRQIPVIVVSVVDARSRTLTLGAAEHLLKPITRQQFQHALNQVLSTTPPVPKTALVLTPSQSSVSSLILLAEDNEANITTTTLYLHAHGLEVMVARNGMEALQMAQQYQPALILMDIQMPEMDGLEATRQIRADPKLSQIPIIALTALAMPGDRDRCLVAGANEYMTKPVSLKQLLHLILTYVPTLRTGE